jgi:hypothetical protein
MVIYESRRHNVVRLNQGSGIRGWHWGGIVEGTAFHKSAGFLRCEQPIILLLKEISSMVPEHLYWILMLTCLALLRVGLPQVLDALPGERRYTSAS